MSDEDAAELQHDKQVCAIISYPTPLQWDSPNVDTRNSVPKLDIAIVLQNDWEDQANYCPQTPG